MLKSSYTDGFFNVSKENGFLPIKDPMKTLPDLYIDLQNFINNLPTIIKVPNQIVKQVYLIPDYTNYIEKENDIFILQALYRAYTFLSSAYTLELSYQDFIKNGKNGKYGKARRIIPQNISVPLCLISNRLQVYPWLDYHYSYSLGNYVKKDPHGDLNWKNLKMACSFTDTSDETGFIMLHVYINELSPLLIESVLNYTQTNDIENLKSCYKVMKNINHRRREMWDASNHKNYNDFRIFIMGIKGNDEIFDDGVLYENCFDNIPQKYRGQTGAQDNIIPTMDIFTGIADYYPTNQLTEYLLDLRSYRPVCIQDFLHDLREHYKNNPILKKISEEKNIKGLIYLYQISNEIYFFRNGHWQFVQKYIMENTNYKNATGGTPITSWLINQIEAVLKFQKDIIDSMFTCFSSLSKQNDDDIKDDINTLYSYHNQHNIKVKLLLEQTDELNKLNYNIEIIYLKNIQANLEDMTNFTI